MERYRNLAELKNSFNLLSEFLKISIFSIYLGNRYHSDRVRIYDPSSAASFDRTQDDIGME